ncbi:hypothetical protein L208DRAFT_62947 [Tricholoma matsutake]|nr:hypothetical protein L208DRAFT_62947 [Tricholoma matsutake 945]
MCKRERTDGIVGHPLAAEVAPITLEVGGQGKLGRQVRVPDAKGVLFELVWNVNRMCSSFRSVAVATTAVARSGLTQKVGI